MRNKIRKLLGRGFVILLLLFPCVICWMLPVSAASTIELNSTARTLYKGQSYMLKVSGTKKKIKWKTSNSKVAKVSAAGKVTAQKAGIATITANVSGKIFRAKITVKNPTVNLNKSSAVIYTSGTTSVQLKAIVKGASQKVTWKSGNKKIATVNSEGKVTAKKAGTVTITAKANGKTAKCKVTVKKKKQKVAGKQAQHKKYVSYIEKFDQKNKKSMKKYKGVMYTGSLSARTYFAFADIDGNGTDECIVRFTSGRNGETTDAGIGGQLERTEIYTIQNGKVKAVVEQDAAWYGHYQGVSVYRNSNLIGYYTSGHSVIGYEFYTYANGNLSKLPKYSCYAVGGSYYINGNYETGRKVAYTEYKAYIDRVKVNPEGYPMYVYTSTNLKKFI